MQHQLLLKILLGGGWHGGTLISDIWFFYGVWYLIFDFLVGQISDIWFFLGGVILIFDFLGGLICDIWFLGGLISDIWSRSSPFFLEDQFLRPPFFRVVSVPKTPPPPPGWLNSHWWLGTTHTSTHMSLRERESTHVLCASIYAYYT